MTKYANESTEKLESLLKLKTVEALDKAAIRKILEERTDGEAPAEGKSEKKTTAKKTPKKAAAKKAPAKKKEPKKPGVIQTIYDTIADSKKPVSIEDILKKLIKAFPAKTGETMIKTIKAQIGTKKSPTRMERERKVEFVITEKKEVRYFALKK